jgi:hypothetical protein
MRNSSVVRMESVRRKDRTKRAVNRICARRRCSDVVRMELLRRRATRRKGVPNRPNLLRPPLHPQWKKNNSSPSTVNCRSKSTLKLTSKFNSIPCRWWRFFHSLPAGIILNFQLSDTAAAPDRRKRPLDRATRAASSASPDRMMWKVPEADPEAVMKWNAIRVTTPSTAAVRMDSVRLLDPSRKDATPSRVNFGTF